jgi:methionyl-tRNA formyltransferase
VTDERVSGPRVRTVFLGSGAFAVPSLAGLAAHEAIDLLAVVTAPSRPAGRRQESSPTPVERAARELDLGPIMTPTRLRAPGSIEAVLALRPGLVVLADYGQIVPAALLGMTHGALNLHPSLLPRHRGATPVPAAILAGDSETGVTLMRMDAGLDTGPIVAQVTRALDGTETTPALEAELAIEAATLLGDRLGPWLRGEVEAHPQPEDGVTLTRPLRREDGRLDTRGTATQLERQVRAYQPWPGSFVDTPMGRLVVWSGSASPGPGSASDQPPGIFDADGLIVDGGERLNLHEVQPAGGKRMSWEAYVRGRPGIVGSRALSTTG